MRTTHGKSSLDPQGQGAPALVAAALRALAADGLVERATHGFHTYPAGLHPDAAAILLGALPGASVRDPFCGGGTVLVEAMLAGRRAIGRDLSSVACLVARARTTLADDATLTTMRSTARSLADEARAARTPPPDTILEVVDGWYEPHVLIELEGLRRGLLARELPDAVADLLWACFSSILVKASWRASDTSARREPHQRPPGTTAILFHKKARELGRRLQALREAVPEGTPSADVALGDARRAAATPAVDLVLTSPPYPTVYDYLPMQQLREAWLEVRSPAVREIGARRAWRVEGASAAEAAWRLDTTTWMRSAAAGLVDGGHLVVVIGDGRVASRAIDAGSATVELGGEAGLELVAHASVGRPEHARGGVRREHVVVLRRPA